MVSRIYVGDRQTLLHTNSVSSGPHGFREDLGDRQTLLHTNSVSSGPHGFREEAF